MIFESLLTRADPSRHTPSDPRGAGFMRVGFTEPVLYITGQSRTVDHVSKHVWWVYTLVGWLVLGPSYFSRTMSCSLFFCPVFFAAVFYGVRAENNKSATHTPALSRALSARPPGRPRSSSRMASASTPTSELATQSPALASSLAEPPLASSPQLGRRICQQGLRSARVRGLLLLVLLLLR